MRRWTVLTVLVAVGALSIAIARAQQDPTAVRIEQVKDGLLYIVTGGRGTGAQAGGVAGNTTVFIADSGVVLVDTKYPGLGKAILDQVKSVTSKPITTIINTHTHGDHTGGNSEFPRTVEIVAHENTKANMARMDEFKGEIVAFLPKKTFKDTMSLFGGKDRIDLYYFGPGHTNGDTVITGHSTTTIGSGPDVTFVRSNPVMTWADLQEHAEFMRDFVGAAEAARKSGKSVDEAVNGLKLPNKYKDYSMAQAKADVQKVYDESKR